MYLNYKSVSQLNRDIIEWLPTLPRDIDAVVGIPRSGLLVANLVALYRNIPISDLDSFLAGSFMKGGSRLKYAASEISKVLILDDSLCSGASMQQARQRVADSNCPFRCIYGAVYVTPENFKKADFYHQILPSPRIFEWNLFHHNILQNVCMDIDGVLCRDPNSAENDDGVNYVKFLQTVPLKYRPTLKVGWLVTARLEKYRKYTETWLRENNIDYGELCMLDLPNKQARVESCANASFKAAVYRKTNAELFIESSLSQACEISALTGKQVICTDVSKVVYPNGCMQALQSGVNHYRGWVVYIKGILRPFWRVIRAAICLR